MKNFRLQLTAALLALGLMHAPATVRYVNLASTNATPPYLDWNTAATNIQVAVDAAEAGDQILVTNGVYATGGRVVAPYLLTNRVVVDKAVKVQSVNGPEVTIIQGNPTTNNNAVRCLYLADGAVLSGFTLTAGATRNAGDATRERSGGGVWCVSTNAVLTNCVLASNLATRSGGGGYSGTFIDCTLTNNQASGTTAGLGGGGVFAGMLTRCYLTRNSTTYGGAAHTSTLNHCILTRNSASYGGGAYLTRLDNCTLSGNSASADGGAAHNSTLNHCALSANSASYGGGANASTLKNCTLTGNSASLLGGGACSNSLRNCILYYNTAPTDPNHSGGTLSYCCTTPLPAGGTGNLDTEPQLADTIHLAAGSPCLGAGNAAYATGVDIDGEAWANPPAIGCDEFYSGSVTGALTVAIQTAYTNVSPGFVLNFTAQITGHAGASRWEFDDGTIVSNRPAASRSWALAGNYLVVLRAYNESLPDGVSATQMVHVVEPPVHYVVLGATNPVAPYTTWNTAAATIQPAVDAATVPGSLVLVSNGVYQTGARRVYGSMSNRVAVTRPITVKSFNGPEVTVIQGNPTSGNTAVRCVYLASGASLMGFTLSSGATRTSGDIIRERSGGGVWCESVSAVVSNCFLAGNWASYYGGGACFGLLEACTASNNVAYYGGGVANSTLNHCTVSTNSAEWGGGAYDAEFNHCTLAGNAAGADGGAASSSTLNGCTLTGNTASGNGGGADACMLNDCVLTSNSAASDGGAANGSTLSQCIVGGNSALWGGGAASGVLTGCRLGTNSAVAGGGGAYFCTLNDCVMTGNSSGARGGAAYESGLTNCTLAGNTAASQGGGAQSGVLTRCTLTGNSAPYGGGAYGTTLNACSLTGNSASAAGGGAYFGVVNNGVLVSNVATLSGGGAFSSTLNNCTLTGNSAATAGGADSCTLTNCIVYDNIAPADANYSGGTLDYCCTIPLPPAGVGNVTNAPLFADAAAGNYRLLRNSPCVDTGADLSAIFTNDFDGNLRPVDGNSNLEARFDMGAFEFLPRQLFVWQDSPSPAAPFTNWDTAAHTIQDAVDAADTWDQILVTNGVYQVGGRRVPPDSETNRLAVDKPVTVQSVNGATVTSIDGGHTMRGAYLADGAVLTGFTLSNGNSSGKGGGVYCTSTNVHLSDCLIIGNSATMYGGGIYFGTLSNCTLSNNSALNTPYSGGAYGGGAYSSNLKNCIVIGNRASYTSGTVETALFGGGVYGGTLDNCVLAGNSVNGSGGGARECTLNRCIVTNNFALWGGGANSCTLNNCVLAGNQANGGGGVLGGTLNQCTLAGNTGFNGGGGASQATLADCILYYNTGSDGANVFLGTANYCCTTPLPTTGIGNFTNEPLFVDLVGGNLRLESNSPCINAGTNFYSPAGPDLDGNPRIVGGTVDAGAYECQSPTLLPYYAWLQNYGLSTYSQDLYVDSDNDRLNNWQEWRCGTDPTNDLSLLQLLTPGTSESGLTVTWESVADRTYFLERGTNFNDEPAFLPLATGIPGQPGTTVFTDTNAVDSRFIYYRVGVEE